jgi:arabinofuranan 3-O-arabinosyltransferase
VVLAVFNAAMLVSLYFTHDWLVDAEGHLIHTDFVNVWAAGKLALDGHPANGLTMRREIIAATISLLTP